MFHLTTDHVARIAEEWRFTLGEIASAVTRNQLDLPERSSECIESRSQYRGNRIVSHFYPDHWARVQKARATQARYTDDL